MIVSRKTTRDAAERAMSSSGRRIRELRLRETAALRREDYRAATEAAVARHVEQEVYDAAVAAWLRPSERAR